MLKGLVELRRPGSFLSFVVLLHDDFIERDQRVPINNQV